MKALWTFIRFHLWLESRRELAYLDTPEARKEALRDVETKLRRDRHYRRISWYAYLPLLVYFLVIGLGLNTALLPASWISGVWSPFAMPVLALVAVLSHAWLGRRMAQRYLRRYLRRKGILICLRCGYDLRGLLELRCPECGTSFKREGDAT